MNFFAASGLVNGLISTVCGATVFYLNPKSRKNITYILYCISLSVWSYFYCAWQLSDDPSKALLFSRALMMGAIFIPTFHYHHIVTLFDLMTPRRRLVLRVAYVLTVIYFLSNFTPLFISKVEKRSVFPYWPVPGPVFHPYLVMFMTLLVLSLTLMWEVRKKASPILSNGMAWIAFATVLGYGGGSTNFPLWYNIPIKPYLNVAVSFYIGINALLFFRLQLIDIQLVGRNVVTKACAWALMGFPLLVGTLLSYFLGSRPGFLYSRGPGDLACAVLNFSLALTLLRNYEDPHFQRLRRLFLLLGIWELTVLILTAPSYAWSTHAYRFSYALGTLVLWAWFYFWQGYFDNPKSVFSKLMRWGMNVTVPIMLCLSLFTTGVLKSLQFDPEGYLPAKEVPGFLYSLYGAWFVVMLLLMGLWASFSLRDLSRDIYHRLKGWVLACYGLGTCASASYFLFVVGKAPWLFYPVAEVLLCLSLIGAISVRVRLFDQEATKPMAMGFGVVSLVLPFVAGAMLTESMPLRVTGALLVAFFAPRIVESIQQSVTAWVDQMFFRGKFSYLEKVKEKMATIRETAYTYDALASSIVEAVQETFPIEMVSVYFLDVQSKKFHLKAQFGMKNPMAKDLRYNRDSLGVSEDDSLIRYITGNASERNLMVVREEISFGPQRRKLEVEAADTLSRIEAEVCAPFLFAGAVKGMLIVGKKKGNRMFHDKDLEAIFAFSRIGEELMRYIMGMEYELQNTALYSHDTSNDFKSLLLTLQVILSPASEKMPLEESKTYLRQAADVMKKLYRTFQVNRDRSSLILKEMRGEYEREPVDIAKIMKDSSAKFDLQAREKGIHFSKQIIADSLMVEGNAEHLGRVFDNLLGNAFRYVQPDGHVTLTGTNTGGVFRASVEDDGAGIDPADLDRIWEFGWQVKDSKQGASGLGLAFAKKVIQLHGGKIWVESPGKGKGAKFAFVIPVMGAQFLGISSDESKKEGKI